MIFAFEQTSNYLGFHVAPGPQMVYSQWSGVMAIHLLPFHKGQYTLSRKGFYKLWCSLTVGMKAPI